jgi:hypothetical protein
MVLSGLVCGMCGAPAIMAIAPGLEAVRSAAIDLRTRRCPIVERAEADRAWCQTCWRRRFKTERKRR